MWAIISRALFSPEIRAISFIIAKYRSRSESVIVFSELTSAVVIREAMLDFFRSLLIKLCSSQTPTR